MSRREHNSVIESTDPITGKRKTLGQFDAETRQIARDNRTPEEQLQVLNDRLGAGVGAVKERNRLLTLLATA